MHRHSQVVLHLLIEEQQRGWLKKIRLEGGSKHTFPHEYTELSQYIEQHRGWLKTHIRLEGDSNKSN